MGRPRKGTLSQSELARKYGVTPKTLFEWRTNEGLDLTDEAAVAARAERAALNKSTKGSRQGSTEDEREAKLRKLTAEADMLEHKLAVQRGEYVAAHEVKAEGMRIGGVIKGMFLRMPDDLPPLLAGRTAAEIKKTLTIYTRDKLTELSVYESPVKIEP